MIGLKIRDTLDIPNQLEELGLRTILKKQSSKISNFKRDIEMKFQIIK